LLISTPNALLICWAILRHPKRELRCFSSMIAWMSSGDGPLGAGLPFLPDEYSSWYLRYFSRAWNFNNVDGRIITAARWIRRGSRNSDQKPNRNRSSAERLSARRRERLMTRSCCFMADCQQRRPSRHRVPGVWRSWSIDVRGVPADPS